ncbi:MAG: tetratricopeptide repeat protein [Egibacteraceae bacterium]
MEELEYLGDAIRAARLRRGWSQEKLAREVVAASPGVDTLEQATVSKWERGDHLPRVDFRPALRQLLGDQVAHLFDRSERSPSLALDKIAASEAVQLARLVEASTVATGTLEMLDQSVDRLARDYPHSRPEVLIPRVRRRLRYVKQLLETRLTLGQRRHLIVDGGWLALLLAVLQFDTGDQSAAEASRDAAFELGREGGHEELMAWTHELSAWFALLEGAYPRVVDHARAGRDLASGTSAGVQLAVQEAKAWARLGDRRRAEEAMRTGAAALARLPTPTHPDHHFVFDSSKLSFYAATVYVWLGILDRAEEHALHVIDQCTIGDGMGRWPTRLAVAHIDLGLIAARRGEYAEAAERGLLALGAGRVVSSTMEWVSELDGVLSAYQGGIQEARSFHERYVTACRAGGDPG